jgi:hypothetical protein
MAASTSSIDMKIPLPGGFALKQRSPSMEKKQIAMVLSANGRQQSSPQRMQQTNPFAQQQQSSTSSFQPQSTYQAPAQTITSLGVPTLGAVKKVAPRKPQQDDDIFASMGLSAQPKFETSRPVVRTPPSSGGASAWGALAAAPAMASSSLAVPAAMASSSDAWDDGDLDDLLDE